MNYSGVIIEESLTNPEVLRKITIVSTRIEPVTEAHKTPWLKQWTLHTIEIAEDKMASIAKEISSVLHQNTSTESSWYADFKNNQTHFIIFKDRVFEVTRQNPAEYQAVVQYGASKGIPDYQLDFSPQIAEWKRSPK